MMEVLSLEASIENWIGAIGLGIDVFGVVIIVVGVVWSTFYFLFRRREGQLYDSYKGHIGRSLLLGLEMLVAADIVRTIALEATFTSIGVLAGLVAVRTFLSWSLVVEIDGRWPWQIARNTPGDEKA
jgi:uncharacterized membrane protein